MAQLTLLARRGNEAINNWLSENPLILGLLALGLGLVIGGWGIYELKQGVARDKYGNEMQGGLGKTMAIIRIVAGSACILFGLFKMIS